MDNAALLYALVENAIDGIITINDVGIIETINPSACTLFGYSQDEVLGNNISMLMPSPDRERHDHYLDNSKVTGQASIIGVGRELLGRRKDGVEFPMKLSVSEVKYAGRKIYAGFIHDLSQQKAAEELLKNYASHLEELVENRTKSLNDTIQALEKSKEKVSQSLEKEKELSKLKSRFLSMASHEFRTPLSTVQLSASLIEKYAEPFESSSIAKHVGKIKGSVSSLTGILNDFLYLEQLEVGKVKVNITTFDMVRFSEEIAEEMQLLAKDEQHILFKHSGVETIVSLDPNLLKNCIINLITNAIKYSGNQCCIKFDTKISNGQCLINIQDNGIGIPLEDQKHLFGAFFRAHNT
ncbi:MAG TPA: PAS domain-containing sensor histidine kinase, partial [Flavobacterium sp.]